MCISCLPHDWRRVIVGGLADELLQWAACVPPPDCTSSLLISIMSPHRVTVGGLVDRPRSFSMDELVSLPSVTITSTLVRPEAPALMSLDDFSTFPAGRPVADAAPPSGPTPSAVPHPHCFGQQTARGLAALSLHPTQVCSASTCVTC